MHFDDISKRAQQMLEMFTDAQIGVSEILRNYQESQYTDIVQLFHPVYVRDSTYFAIRIMRRALNN